MKKSSLCFNRRLSAGPENFALEANTQILVDGFNRRLSAGPEDKNESSK